MGELGHKQVDYLSPLYSLVEKSYSIVSTFSGG